MANVADLRANVRSILRDADADVYTDELIADSLYHGELMVVAYKPEATAETVDIPVVAGAAQTIPAAYGRLLDIKHNGTLAAPGAGIRLVGRENLDLFDPSWRAATPGTSATQYTFDERQPTQFELCPPVQAGFVVGSLSKRPVPYADPGNDTTMVGDEHNPALIEWCLYRLFSEDTEGSVNEARSRKHYGNFFNFYGMKIPNEARVSPRQPENKS